MSQFWEAHTVVAKSVRTFLDVGIRKIGPRQGLIRKPSSPSGSKADTERLHEKGGAGTSTTKDKPSTFHVMPNWYPVPCP